MPRKTLIGIGVCGLLSILLFFLWRKNDGMTPVQRDISKSLERAKVLKTKRDSIAQLQEPRFTKFRGKKEEVEKLEKKEEVAQSQEVGRTSNSVASVAETSSGTQTGEMVDMPPAPKSAFDAVPTSSSTKTKPDKPVRTSPELVSTSGMASIPSERFFTTSAMDGLTPQGKQSVFKPGQAVYIYAGINAPQAEQVRLEWVDPDGKIIGAPEYVNVQSNTGVNGYRIYKQRQFRNPGKYEVRLYNGAGVMIGKVGFSIADAND